MTTQPQGDQENFVCPHPPVNISSTGFYDYGKMTGKPIGGWEQLGPPTLGTSIPVRYDIQKPDYEAAYHKLARIVSMAFVHSLSLNAHKMKESLSEAMLVIEDVEAPKTVLDTKTR